MLAGHDLVYFGPEKWDGLWRNRHQLMSRFAHHHKVLYVEPKTYLRTTRHQWRTGSLRWQDLWRDLRQSRVTKAAEHLYIYRNPIVLPISGRFPLDRITWFLWRGLLKSTMKKLNFSDPIIWLSRPSMVNLVDALDEKLVIYHVVDEYLSYCQGDVQARTRQQTLERQMLKKADLVIVVSESLFQAKQPFNEHTYLVPNGVDYQAYARAMDSNEPPPPDIAELPKPLIGYSGLIASRLDLNLLRHLATTHPDWSIVLLGTTDDRNCAVELMRLRQTENVHFLGRREIDQVPRYIQAFDVCIIPYQIDERAQNASPLKLYDYMAAGKPIVTTNFSAANQFKKVVRVADNQEEFLNYIKDALSENDHDLCLERQRIAAENTWEQRVRQLSRIVQFHLETGEQGGKRE
jgi:glycosyltransferase involved in cell wall biosynthesis